MFADSLLQLLPVKKLDKTPPKGWLEPDPNGKQLASLDLSILKESNSGTLHSMGLPIHVYPLYENGRRAHRRLSATENSIESAQMYAEFDRIGSENE
ncbi:hypothetical protein J3459_019453 [Metarhizium acridum]|nr:hypothetical protein J3459_019453 [Metarhizium acridum]